MVKAEITKSDGTKIIIDGSEEEVKRILSYENKIVVPEKRQAIKNENKKQLKSSGKLSISDQIEELKEEGFFDQPKGLIEIKNVLSEKGMIYAITTLSGKVIEKVRKRELGRIKEENKWKYVKR